MASGFFALLDDIAVLMDDVAAMTKITTKKTAGILGDDLAVNAEKASGFVSSREIPVLWAITKGSFLNKLIILPLAFLLSAFLPSAVVIILVLGGLYLAYEGAEKIFEFFVPHPKKETVSIKQKLTKEEVLSLEKTKIKSAIITDFILSVEIVIIALGSVVKEPLATVGVYGIVALIVRMDDLGFRLINKSNGEKGFLSIIGNFLVQALPKIIKSLSVIGTIALLLVSGGIFVHNIEYLHHFLEQIPSILRDFIVGLFVGAICVLIVKVFKMLFFGKSSKH